MLIYIEKYFFQNIFYYILKIMTGTMVGAIFIITFIERHLANQGFYSLTQKSL